MHASCLCGDVSWELDAPFEWMSHCHCSICRKTHGVAFATYVAASAAGFRLEGREHIVRFESSPGFFRCFCGHCGSVVAGDPTEGRVFAPTGNFHDDPGARPVAHIFVASNAPWHEITDALPRVDTYPPGVDAPVVPDRPRDPVAAPIHGSCQCDAIAFESSAEPVMCRNCHCLRCRKARSAAHASNLVVPVDGFRFTRGEDNLASYKVPGAKFFTQTFCATCGSPMPRVDTSRGFAVIPMGALDADPNIKPRNHIFVASKAPWFEITDNLPQFQDQQPT
jgi:hypothetical protein